jgi:hypothetical protein
MNIRPLLVVACFSSASAALVSHARAEPAAPEGSIDNPKQVKSTDRGPDVDPKKLAASPYNGLPMFATLRSFMSSSYAWADVWVYAEDDDQRLYDARVVYTYPEFYTPSWGEVFDHVARQARAEWAWNPDNRQFRFRRSDDEPFYGVTLADGWSSQDRGLYVWHAPADAKFGFDVYYFGHFTAPEGEPDFARKVREHFAVAQVSQWPEPPTAGQMTLVDVAGTEALHLKADTPRPGGVWRQWSLLVEGHAFVIVSAMPKAREPDLVPAVEQMLKSFKVRPQEGGTRKEEKRTKREAEPGDKPAADAAAAGEDER